MNDINDMNDVHDTHDEMRKSEFFGFLIICSIALALTLVFYTTNVNNWFLNMFVPVTNSLWDFGRVMFMSILIYSVFQYFVFGKFYPNFFFAKAAALFLAPMIFLIGSYYTEGLAGITYANSRILMFVLAVGLGQSISFYFLQNELYFKLMNGYAILGIVLMLSVFLANLYQSRTYNHPIFNPERPQQQNILLFRR